MGVLTAPRATTEAPPQVDVPPPTQRIVLDDVSWEEYVALGDVLRDRPALRMTYDSGRLELMTTSSRHEIYKKWLGRFIEILAEEFGLNFATAGNMTFQRPEILKGLEADDCFWIANEPKIRGKLSWDPLVDPPPDLALEIEITRSILNRMKMLAALGVGELWRFNASVLRVLVLGKDREYAESPASPTFPGIPIGEVARFLVEGGDKDYWTRIREFRDWVRALKAGPASANP